MNHRLLGRSGLRVSELCLGTMTFGEDWGWGAPPEDCRAMYELFREQGGTFVDTANKYTNGSSERIVGDLIVGHRDEVVLATKYTLSSRPGDLNAGGNHRKNLVQSLEASLERLQTDHIDLYWLHAWDFTTGVDEVMRALDDQVRAGKILYVGVSDTPAWVVSQANTLSDLRGWSPFVALQIEYSLIQRTVERELVPMAKALDLAVTPWASLGGGVLAGKYSAGVPADEPSRMAAGHPRLSERNLAIAGVVGEIAAELEVPAAAVAVAWVLGRPGVMIPILGARRAAQLEQSLQGAEVELSADQITRLDEVSHVDLGFPHEFLTSDMNDDLVFGGARDSLRAHRGPLAR